ncbi:U4/U6 small nuclear ribonucleoprotein Prp31 [Delitschia confertaspora ATCC 74209]|uniref:U4/U6 small nuclear ribonucleoprotein Prp31 n=1 Tax=Delitschia confertaspora ATCC 74209 TaxID=1513339 RepID=A0A9P4JID9_9PLEO|nr:U4/U6 small nuclear ribonucleoprotein Prp31 [Delitschia confertaspora ATCC 74209]
MATLEQELLLDFADSGSEGEGEGQDGVQDDLAQLEKDFGGSESADDDDMDVDEEAQLAAEHAEKKRKGPEDMQSAASLVAKLGPVLKEIEHYKENPEPATGGSVEDNPEYQLLTQANTLSTSIDGEIAVVHKFIRDHYFIRFPYLEDLIKNPIDYAKTVAIIGNEPMGNIKIIAESADNMVGVPLKSILDGPSLMVVTVEAIRAEGRNLTDAELSTIRKACAMMLELDKAKRILTEYVQSRMNMFAPNLTVLIGSLTAAQLLNFAGGLTGLAKTPACNLTPLGSNKASGTGFSNIGIRHQGFLYHSPIIQAIRHDLRKQAMRIVSNKVILAARVDSVHESPDGSMGQQFKDDCERRLDKLTEPPPNKGIRALPAPDDKPSRKRGGRRARKAKEATAMTEIRKAQNRMAFGKEEKEVGYADSTKGLGMIGAQDTGRLRAQQIDQRTRAKLSKKNPGWGGVGGAATSLGGAASQIAGNATMLKTHGLRAGGVGNPSMGTSSIAFTPVQGLELVDPKVRDEMNRKRKADEDRWFKGGTFTQVGPSKVDSAGFKIPALPAMKNKVNTRESKRKAYVSERVF